jgi:predicted nucleic acid-binding protein
VRIAFDSNFLLYLALVARSPEDERKNLAAHDLLLSLPDNVERIAPYQVLGECYRVMLRSGYAREACRRIVMEWADGFETVDSREDAFIAAIDLATDHKLQFWDALIINVAADAGCRLLLSEDLQPGFVWRGVTIVNPFAPTMDHRLAQLISTPQ